MVKALRSGLRDLLLKLAELLDDPPFDCQSCQHQKIVGILLGQHRNQTSGKFLFKIAINCLECFIETRNEEDAKRLVRLRTLVNDVWIKCYSYKWINGLFFFLTIGMVVFAISWPVIIDYFKMGQGSSLGLLQYVFFSLATLFFVIYSQYKKKQRSAESLLRDILFSERPLAEKIDSTMKTIFDIDSGMSLDFKIFKKEQSG